MCVKTKVITLLLVFLLIVLSCGTALASNVTGAAYIGRIKTSNTGASVQNVWVPFTLSTQNLIDGDMINSTATDAAIRTAAGIDAAFMPGVGANPWVFHVPDITVGEEQYFMLYSKGVTGGKIRYFPAAGGMTAADSATLELGNNFEIEQKGFIDTAAGVDKHLIDKPGAFRVYVPSAGNITAAIAATGVDLFPTGFVDSGSTWSSETNAYDDNTGTWASHGLIAGGGTWTNFLELTYTESQNANQVKYYASSTYAAANIDIDVYYSGSWHDVSSAALVQNTWTTVNIGSYQDITAIRVRFQNNAGDPGAFLLKEARLIGYGFTKTVTIAVASGEHTLVVSADTVNLSIAVDGGAATTVALAGASVLDNANNWSFLTNGSMPYMEYQKITIGGVLQQHIVWENAATFNDLSAGNHDATPSFRTTSSDADVSATLEAFHPATSYSTPLIYSVGQWELIGGAPVGDLYGELDMTFFGAGVIQKFANDMGVSLALLVFIYAFGLAIILGLLAFRLTMGSRENKHSGSLLVQALVSGVVMTYFVVTGNGVIPGLVLVFFGLEVLAAFMLMKSHIW